MKVTLPYLVVLLVRGEGSKTPLTVLPHEVEILKHIHGDDNIIETDDVPPIEKATFDTEDELARLEQYYHGDNERPNPTRAVFRNLDEFEASFNSVGGEDKAALVEEAKALGIAATMNWGIAKLQDAIAAAKE